MEGGKNGPAKNTTQMADMNVVEVKNEKKVASLLAKWAEMLAQDELDEKTIQVELLDEVKDSPEAEKALISGMFENRDFKSRYLHSEEAQAFCFRDMFYQADIEIPSDDDPSKKVKTTATYISGVSGYVRPGESLALLGAPDSQVDTLLRLLAQRDLRGKSFGTILYGGRPPMQDYHLHVAYVPKYEVQLATLTVTESLRTSLRLRLDRSVPDFVVELYTKKILHDMGLDNCADNIIGDQNIRGVSGGEKRRCTIANESGGVGSLTIMDLPTNGLDSATAYNFCEQTINACKANNTSCIMSVAQPAPELMDLFDNLLLMAKGKQIWFGPPREAVQYFENLGFIKPDIVAYPDFLQEMCGGPHVFYVPQEDKREAKRTPITRNHRVDEFDEKDTQLPLVLDSMNTPVIQGTWRDLVNSWRESPEFRILGGLLWEEFAPRSNHYANLNTKAAMATPSTQMRILIWRQWTYIYRNKSISFMKMGLTIFLVLFFASMFWNPEDTFEGQNTKLSALMMMTIMPCFLTNSWIPSLVEQIFVHNFQASSHYYSIIYFLLALMTVDFFWISIEALLWVTGFSYFADLKGDPFVSEEYWLQYIVILGLLILGKSMVNWSVLLLQDEQLAAMAQQMPLLVMMFDMGFFLPKMNAFWEALQYVNPMYFGFKALSIAEWKDKENIEHTVENEDGSSYLLNIDGKTYLEFINVKGFKDGDEWLYALYLWLITFGFFLVAIHAAYKNVKETFKETKIDKDTEDMDREKNAIVKRKSELALVKPENEVVISWENLVYIVPDPKDKDAGMCGKKRDLRILKGVHGFAKPGSLIALMGPSGAGKTTLLDVLAGRKTGGITTGDIKINGYAKDETFNYIAGYVEQFDSHEPYQTVLEAITFVATLRLPRSLDEEGIRERVEAVLTKLKLQSVKNEMIGSDELGGISPEYRKKVSIACEMVVDPGLLFLDEPTTGLDAASARNVMQSVKNLSATRAVVCTIHQPSAEIFEVFTDVLLMQKGGRVCYFGSREEVADYFEEQGFPKIEKGVNVADYALECSMMVGDECPGKDRITSDKSNLDITSPADLFESHSRHETLLREVETCGKDMEQPKVDLSSKAGFMLKLRLLMRRSYRAMTRNKMAFIGRISNPFVQGVLFGLPFLQLKNDASGLKGKESIMMFFIIILGFGGMANLPVIFGNRLHEYREKESRMYGEIPLWLSSTILNYPIQLFCDFFMGNIIFWLVGMTITWESYLCFLLFTISADLLFSAVCDSLIAMSASLEMVMMFQTASLMIWNMCCGFYIKPEEIPSYWQWAYWFNAFRWPMQSLYINEFENLPPNELIEGTDGIPLTGQQYIESLGITEFTKWECFGISLAFYVFLKLTELLIRCNVTHIKR